jgi:hypothetical protein
MTYAIQFDFPEGVRYAGLYQGALGWAPTLKSAEMYDDPEVALRVLKNGYGSIAEWGKVIPVKVTSHSSCTPPS